MKTAFAPEWATGSARRRKTRKIDVPKKVVWLLKKYSVHTSLRDLRIINIFVKLQIDRRAGRDEGGVPWIDATIYEAQRSLDAEDKKRIANEAKKKKTNKRMTKAR